MLRKICLGLTALLLPLLPAQAQISDGEVRIGIITDMSSIYREVGRVADIAAEMAVNDHGGRVLGKPVRIFIRDHKSDPQVALEAARELHEEHNVDAFLEMVSTEVALAVQQYAKDNDILALHTGAGGSILTGEACSPLGVHWVYDTHALAAGTAAAVTESGGDSWFFVTADSNFGRSLEADASAVVKRMGERCSGAPCTAAGQRLQPPTCRSTNLGRQDRSSGNCGRRRH
ncbi:hypothetical protein CAL65_15095 [Alkalilimnicola ehrlichii]|uniref:Leucine-binding protein domain-containing protein n=1 Tax=Alkalilimnicola ehrlichii TaxID=351052 RepID=A0A3E0WPP4_9GAMM|nr:hypothetical protein CAL65_15095 [Alkalilimnicola ehrlichii]